jgi:hypothetical protein
MQARQRFAGGAALLSQPRLVVSIGFANPPRPATTTANAPAENHVIPPRCYPGAVVIRLFGLSATGLAKRSAAMIASRLRTNLAAPLLTCLCTPAFAGDVILGTSATVDPQLVTVDPVTHAVLSAIDITGEQALFGGLTFDGASLYSLDGYFDGVSNRTFRIDASNGAGVVVGNIGSDWGLSCIENHPLTGVLYAVANNNLYTLSKTTGAATLIGSLTGSTVQQISAIAINSAGMAYGVDVVDSGLFAIDLTNASMTHLGDLNLPVWGFVQDLAFDSQDRLWCVLDSGPVYTIDIASVTSTYQFGTNGWGGIAFADCPMPVTYCTSSTSSGGCTLSIDSSGTPITSASSGFTLLCANVAAQRTGIFFYGVASPSFAPTLWAAGGTSFLCVKSPTQRMPAMDSGGTSGCSGLYAHDWNAFMFNNAGALGNPLTVGASFDAQLWMRDPPSPKTSILSNALRFTCCP